MCHGFFLNTLLPFRLWKPVCTQADLKSIAKNLDRPDFGGRHERILFAILFLAVRDEKPSAGEGGAEVEKAMDQSVKPLQRPSQRKEDEPDEPPKGVTAKQKKVHKKAKQKTLSSRAYLSFSIPFKLLSLLCCLAETSDHLRAVMPRFANYLHYSIFECNRLYNLKGYQAKNVVRMYLCVLRATGRFSVFYTSAV